jgi:putative superfamily III holin-X
VREELALARAELRQKLMRSLGGILLLGVAAAAGLLGLGALGAGLVLSLALVMPAWGAALVVALASALVAGLAAMAGARTMRRNLPPIPEQAIETLREDLDWARTRR